MHNPSRRRRPPLIGDFHGMPEPVWLFTLLNGLEPAAMRSTHHVLRVIRLRLERYDKERRRAQR